MQKAATNLLGTHDFRCFESHFPNKATSVRTIMEATVVRRRECSMWNHESFSSSKTETDGEFIWFDVVADGFLYNMVRAIVGTLFKVGRGKWKPEDMQRIIQSQDRALAGETAPPQGLYLMHVDYEGDVNPASVQDDLES